MVQCAFYFISIGKVDTKHRLECFDKGNFGLCLYFGTSIPRPYMVKPVDVGYATITVRRFDNGVGA